MQRRAGQFLRKAIALHRFTVAKPATVWCCGCNPGAVLLLPPSSVRHRALRNFFLFFGRSQPQGLAMSRKPLRVAIIGSGISGLAVAHTLTGQADITLYEAGSYFGGHTHTVDVTLGGITHGVDTGFLVYNERTYPNLIALFVQLGVATAKSDMSFSVQVPGAVRGQALEWSGSTLGSLFAQSSNLWNGPFWQMLRDLLRFNALATRIAKAGTEGELQQPLGEFLSQHRFSRAFQDWYFLPMMGCIWSCPTAQMLQFPVSTMVRFCHNHGLLQITNRPQWHTVQGGARHYVEKIIAGLADARLNTPVELVERVSDEDGAGVRVMTRGHAERFDHVVLASHSDQSLALLKDPSEPERAVLEAVAYQPNRAVLHTDTAMLPTRRAAWAAWNYERESATPDLIATKRLSTLAPALIESKVCLHYWLNALQPLPFKDNVVVSLNPLRAIAPTKVIAEFDYAHPVFDLGAVRAQKQLPALQGERNTWYCGAWTGYGFHEDGLKSGLQVGRRLLMEAQTQ